MNMNHANWILSQVCYLCLRDHNCVLGNQSNKTGRGEKIIGNCLKAFSIHGCVVVFRYFMCVRAMQCIILFLSFKFMIIRAVNTSYIHIYL